MPILGKSNSGSSFSQSTAIKVAVSLATASETGIVQSAAAALAFSGDTDTRFCVYANSGGVPGALLAVSDAPPELYSGGQDTAPVGPWREYVFSGVNKIEIVAGTAYWIGPAWAGGTTTTFGRDGTAGGRREGTLSSWPNLANPIVGGDGADRPVGGVRGVRAGSGDRTGAVLAGGHLTPYPAAEKMR